MGKPTTEIQKRSPWGWVLLVLLLAAVLGGGVYLFSNRGTPQANGQESTRLSRGTLVEVVHPTVGGAERTTTQPGSVEAFQWAPLYAEVSGYLANEPADIGTQVTEGQVVAKISVPDLEKLVQQHRAGLTRAVARVKQMKARVDSAQADVQTAEAGIVQAVANRKSAQARREFRDKQYKRLKALYASRTVDERVVDESLDQFTASVEAENAAVAAISTAKAQKTAAEAKLEQARADVKEAEAEVGVVQAELDKAEVDVKFATITSPYTGVVTQRSVHKGAFIRAANLGGDEPPLVTVARVDKVRVIVQVPDLDVPYIQPGDPATVEIDALPNTKFPGTVARLSDSEDPNTRLMRAEIDLANPKGVLRQGMYGRVTIVLDRDGKKSLSIPSSAVVSRSEGKKGTVYVVKDGHAHQVPVQLGSDNGLRVAVYKGLTIKDRVIDNPPPDLTDGTPVRVAPGNPTP